MATTHSTHSTSSTKTDLPPAPANGPAPLGLNDKRGDDQAVLGHFVKVTSGEHEGRYGVFIEVAEGTEAVIRTRDSNSERFTVPIANLEPAEAGLR